MLNDPAGGQSGILLAHVEHDPDAAVRVDLAGVELIANWSG